MHQMRCSIQFWKISSKTIQDQSKKKHKAQTRKPLRTNRSLFHQVFSPSNTCLVNCLTLRHTFQHTNSRNFVWFLRMRGAYSAVAKFRRGWAGRSSESSSRLLRCVRLRRYRKRCLWFRCRLRIWNWRINRGRRRGSGRRGVLKIVGRKEPSQLPESGWLISWANTAVPFRPRKHQ